MSDLLVIEDQKPFVGASDFAVSRSFYVALGWRVNFDDGNLAELECSGHRFYLQNYYQKQWCDNSMLFLAVADTDAWYAHVRAVVDAGNHGAARVNPPKDEDYGARVTYVWDPSGVLLHIAQWR